ncbi:hypothetical protein UFOVP178_40 [uncultured Caudovirales phage]|uniref:Uncharacterized protein n=1 Tax=uncultured Caudovirales phage TaxID=2100421 RepID=A0A6J7WCC7_9CAUD|nr:hypothetical protein UFOVP178_40 [uncultured Caudovirales phage]
MFGNSMGEAFAAVVLWIVLGIILGFTIVTPLIVLSNSLPPENFSRALQFVGWLVATCVFSRVVFKVVDAMEKGGAE